MKHVKISVNGMSCQHCVNAIHEALDELVGMEKVSVELDDKRVVVDFDEDRLSLKTITDAIEEQGYDVV